jgi:hypothetical protein
VRRQLNANHMFFATQSRTDNNVCDVSTRAQPITAPLCDITTSTNAALTAWQRVHMHCVAGRRSPAAENQPFVAISSTTQPNHSASDPLTL